MINRLTKEKSKGFTLIELMVVIAIIAILVTIVINAINPAKILNDTNDSKRRTEINQIKTALQLYYNDNQDYPGAGQVSPDTYLKCKLEGTANSPCSAVGTVYMKQVPAQIYYGYDYVDSSNYYLGAQLNGASDTSSFDKCGISGTSTALYPTLNTTTFTISRSATINGGYLACPD